MTEATGLRPRARDTGVAIAVAMGVMNVSTYGFQMIAARALGPREYGAFAALMNVTMIVGVLALGLQATAARRISSHPDGVSEIERAILRVTYRSAAMVGALLLVLSPVVALVLRLDSIASAAVIGFAAVPLTIMGGQAGVLQGERRWLALAMVYVAAGVPRLVVGAGIVLWQPSELSAMVAVAVTALAPVVAGSIALRGVRLPRSSAAEPTGPGVLGEVARNSQALLAFFALGNVDVMVARNVLDGHDAGLYAAGLIMTKAVLFLPQFVVVVSFPSLSSAHERRRTLMRGLATVAAIGAAATAGALLLPGLAMVFVGGSEYAEIESRLWLFAVLGTLLAMLQLLVYAVVAGQGRRSVYAPWAGVVLVVALGALSDTPDMLLAVVVAADTLLLAVLVTISLYLARSPVVVEDPPAVGEGV
ncbi:polysaccharide biosynthesis protein [Nocardioides sp. 503]|uniref:lipopolysaccharide biosynthesis protein n=1 Tax=Nocardioides sp. 503 TaxID=2508326 RepID=UPI0010702C37|nr:polysaccharide biosynthesis protein [Nocardioides sp. 503]